MIKLLNKENEEKIDIKGLFNKKDMNWKISFLCGALIGAVFFIGIFGIKVLDVTNDDWMAYEFDLTQHIIGWKMYRNSGWHFPFGLCDTSMYPYLTSVVYTDSIPVVALIFKILSPILPDKFQYFGLYGLFCFMMQGGMAKILLRKYIKKEWECNVGAVFFVSSIAFVQRMFWQTALSSHYLLLIGLALFVYKEDISSCKRRVLYWCLLGCLSVSTHFYLYGMLSVMLVGFALLELFDYFSDIRKGILLFVSYIFTYIVSTVIVFYLFGGFYGTIGFSDNNFIHGAYLNALFDPKKFSVFFKGREYSDGDLEGLGYLGIAVIMLFIVALAGLTKGFKDIWKENKKLLIILSLLIVGFLLFSFSPIILWDGNHLFSIDFIPGFILKYSWGLFRSCGRFIWPIVYFIILFAIVYSERVLKKYYPYILVLMMLLQVVEFSGYFKKTYETFDKIESYACPADVFENYDISEYKHIQLMYNYEWIDYYADLTCYYEFVGFGRLATDHKMTMSNFHFARDYSDVVQNQIEDSFEKLYSGNPDKDTFYVFPKEIYEENNLYGCFDKVYELDTGYDIVLIPVE